MVHNSLRPVGYIYFLSFLSMQSLDLSKALAPVINISDVPTLEAMLRAQTAEKIHITIENLTPYTGPQVIPVRVIEGMERVVTRGTVNKKQSSLISALVSLMAESPVLQA